MVLIFNFFFRGELKKTFCFKGADVIRSDLPGYSPYFKVNCAISNISTEVKFITFVVLRIIPGIGNLGRPLRILPTTVGKT